MNFRVNAERKCFYETSAQGNLLLLFNHYNFIGSLPARYINGIFPESEVPICVRQFPSNITDHDRYPERLSGDFDYKKEYIPTADLCK
jgi:hypothetical protein